MKTKTVYLASSKTLYEKPRYSKILKHLKTVYPNDKIIPAKGLYKTPEDFYRKWQHILDELDIVVFATDNYNTIGYGTYQEIDSAIAANKIVLYLDKDFELIPIENVTITILNKGYDWTQYARIKAE